MCTSTNHLLQQSGRELVNVLSVVCTVVALIPYVFFSTDRVSILSQM